MNANELADGLDEDGYHHCADMLRQQQAEIDFLKKEILEKHEDWKHEGQQAANARAEIEALKRKIADLNYQLEHYLNLMFGEEK